MTTTINQKLGSYSINPTLNFMSRYSNVMLTFVTISAFVFCAYKLLNTKIDNRSAKQLPAAPEMPKAEVKVEVKVQNSPVVNTPSNVSSLNITPVNERKTENTQIQLNDSMVSYNKLQNKSSMKKLHKQFPKNVAITKADKRHMRNVSKKNQN